LSFPSGRPRKACGGDNFRIPAQKPSVRRNADETSLAAGGNDKERNLIPALFSEKFLDFKKYSFNKRPRPDKGKPRNQRGAFKYPRTEAHPA